MSLNVNSMMNKLQGMYLRRLNLWLYEVKKKIDELTPELTMDLIEHNKIEEANLISWNVVWGVYNDLWSYEHKVEDWMWVDMTYHKYTSAWKRVSIFGWKQEGAHMFEDWFKEAKDDLFKKLRGW